MDNVAAGPAVDGERDGGDTPLDAAPAACPRCQQTDFNYEDLDEGTKLVCGDCGYVLDAVVLVHQRTYDEAGGRQDGVRVGETDDGGVTGEQRGASQHVCSTAAATWWGVHHAQTSPSSPINSLCLVCPSLLVRSVTPSATHNPRRPTCQRHWTPHHRC